MEAKNAQGLMDRDDITVRGMTTVAPLITALENLGMAIIPTTALILTPLLDTERDLNFPTLLRSASVRRRHHRIVVITHLLLHRIMANTHRLHRRITVVLLLHHHHPRRRRMVITRHHLPATTSASLRLRLTTAGLES